MDHGSRLAALFSGYSLAHGTFTLKKANDAGKVIGQAFTVHNPITPNEWKGHISGSGPGLGVVPLRDDETCLFGAIDIDVRGVDLPDLERKCASLPLTVCRSKSGGAHLYLFLSEPAPAALVVERLHEWAAAVGHGGVEIFPKQTSRIDKRDVGNWINLPYYRAAQTDRYGIFEGKPVSLERFLEIAEKRRIPVAVLEKLGGIEATDDLLDGAPPCLVSIRDKGGLGEGVRNDGMVNIALYLKRRFPSDWQARLMDYNLKLCQPPLEAKEIAVIVKSTERKDYVYTCNKAPIKAFCNRRKCLKQPFGIGEAQASSFPVIGGMIGYRALDDDPVTWALDVDGVRIMVSTEQLMSPTKFNAVCAERINRLPVKVSTPQWLRFLDRLLQGVEMQSLPPDASEQGQFRIYFEGFVFGRVQAVNRDEVYSGKPWRDGGKVYFRSNALLEYLKAKGFNKFEGPKQIWTWLNAMGGEPKNMSIKGKPVAVWVVPEPTPPSETPAPLPQVGTEDF